MTTPPRRRTPPAGRQLAAASVLVLLVLVVLVVVVLPPRFTTTTFDKDHEELKAQNDVRTTLLQGLGALLVLTRATIGASVAYQGVPGDPPPDQDQPGQLQATRERCSTPWKPPNNNST